MAADSSSYKLSGNWKMSAWCPASNFDGQFGRFLGTGSVFRVSRICQASITVYIWFFLDFSFSYLKLVLFFFFFFC